MRDERLAFVLLRRTVGVDVVDVREIGLESVENLGSSSCFG